MSAFDNLPLVIEPAELADRLDAPDLILLDLSSAARYAAGHIPGARWVDTKRTQLGAPPAPGLLPEQAQLEALFADIGHHANAVYVVYDDEGGPWAGRFIWLLDVIDHQRYHFLNGGLQAWISDGLELSQEEPAVTRTEVSLTLSDAPTATREYLQSRLDAADLAIWDVRGADEYRGEKLSSARGGHIPGATHFEYRRHAPATRYAHSHGYRRRPARPGHHARQGSDHSLPDTPSLRLQLRGGQGTRLSTREGLCRLLSEWGNLPDTPIER